MFLFLLSIVLTYCSSTTIFVPTHKNKNPSFIKGTNDKKLTDFHWSRICPASFILSNRTGHDFWEFCRGWCSHLHKWVFCSAPVTCMGFQGPSQREKWWRKTVLIVPRVLVVLAVKVIMKVTTALDWMGSQSFVRVCFLGDSKSMVRKVNEGWGS